MMRSRSCLATVVLAVAATLGAAGAQAATSRDDLISRTLVVRYGRIADYSGRRTATADARITVPTGWRYLGTKHAMQIYRIATDAGCTFTTTVTTNVALADSADAALLAEQLNSAGGPYLLDAGTRDGHAWRVTRQKTPVTALLGVGVYPDGITDEGVGGAGQQGFQIVTFSAVAGTTCHSGGYRDVVGPEIGDALAIARTSAHVDPL